MVCHVLPSKARDVAVIKKTKSKSKYLPKVSQNVNKGLDANKKKKSIVPKKLTSSSMLSLKQLKDIINDIFKSKKKFDKKCEGLNQTR